MVPTKPAAKLSKPTMIDNNDRFASELATNAKNKFVISTLMPPTKRALNKDIFFIKCPPMKKPIIDPDADLLLMNRFLTWGWATWKDRWKEYEPSLKKIVNKF